MQICVKTLTGQAITLDVQDSDTIDNVKDRVEGMVRPSPRDAEAMRRITAGVVLGGTRLLGANNNELFGTVSDMRTALRIGPVLQVLKKFQPDIQDVDDVHISEALIELSDAAVRTMRSPEEHDIEAALSTVPSMSRSLHPSSLGTVTFDVILVFGSPLILVKGQLNVRGISYQRASA